LHDLKIDEKLYYHYFISVGVRTMMSKTPGRIFLKHGPLTFTNDDVKNLQNAALMSKDKLFPTTNREAVEMYGVSEITHAIWAMTLAATTNQCTIHHFSSEDEFPDDFWEGFVDRANTCDFERSKLDGSRVRAGGFF